MVDFPIIESAEGKLRIRVISGYKLPKSTEFACYKEANKNWVIVDLESGLFVEENLINLAACYTWQQTADMIKINNARKTSKYAACKKALKAWKKQNLK